MLTRRPERLRGFSYVGFHRYSLTFCTDRRRPIFSGAETVDIVRVQILRAAQETSFAILAYCFMPDHVHLLASGLDEGADVERFARLSKQRSGYEYARRLGAALWQPSYFDHLLRSEDDTWSVIRYIVENPVRARLAREPRDYRFSGSQTYPLDVLIESACAPGVGVWRRSKGRM